VGISNYRPEAAEKAIKILKDNGTPCLIHQPKYSMFERWVEDGLLDLLEKEQVGCIPFSPLAQGLLTDKYLNGIPSDSRVATSGIFLKENDISAARLEKILALDTMAKERGQKLAQMALAWLLRDARVTSVLIGSSKPEQILDSIKALENTAFSSEELEKINAILK
jgi:L-glyceraldehyde 3-phosphate reductase